MYFVLCSIVYYDTIQYIIQYIIQKIHQMVTITAETVAAAAGRLQGDGTNPTQSAVRTALGGGSFSTIGPLLHKWRDNQAEAAELAKVDLPDTLADAGSDLMSRVWKVAIAEAFAGHDALRKELIQAQVETELGLTVSG